MNEKTLRIVSLVLLVISTVLLLSILIITVSGYDIPEILWNVFLASVVGCGASQIARKRNKKNKEEQENSENMNDK